MNYLIFAGLIILPIMQDKYSTDLIASMNTNAFESSSI